MNRLQTKFTWDIFNEPSADGKTENTQEQATESTPESEADATNLTAEAPKVVPKANIAAASE